MIVHVINEYITIIHQNPWSYFLESLWKINKIFNVKIISILDILYLMKKID